jgi:AbrB family looped-hinge helix DNA binding protein
VAKVTSKLQVTVPKALADRYGIAPGDEIAWEAAGDAIRVVPRPRAKPAQALARRRARFDQATERQRIREQDFDGEPAGDRGWTREDLYDRARPR